MSQNINLFPYFRSLADNHPHQRRTDQLATATRSPFPEKVIKEITKKGFTREQAIEELKATNGDANKALITLITKSLTKPKQNK